MTHQVKGKKEKKSQLGFWQWKSYLLFACLPTNVDVKSPPLLIKETCLTLVKCKNMMSYTPSNKPEQGNKCRMSVSARPTMHCLVFDTTKQLLYCRSKSSTGRCVWTKCHTSLGRGGGGLKHWEDGSSESEQPGLLLPSVPVTQTQVARGELVKQHHVGLIPPN